MARIFGFFMIFVGLFAASDLQAEDVLRWEPAGGGREKVVAVSDDFYAVFLRHDPVVFGAVLVITPRGSSPSISVSSRREIGRFSTVDRSVSTGRLFSGAAGGVTRKVVSFQISDWGGFIVINIKGGDRWLENSRVFRLYSDGTVGVMDGREFWGFIYAGGLDAFRRSATEPQYPAPAAKPTAAVQSASWGSVKNHDSSGEEQLRIMELFK